MTSPTSVPDASPEDLLKGVRAVGEDARRCIRIELDGTGEVVDVVVTSQAKEGNRGALETSIREALVAVTADLRQQRAQHAEQVAAAAARQVGELTGGLAAMTEQATAAFDEALAKIAAAAGRVGR